MLNSAKICVNGVHIFCKMYLVGII